MSVICPAVLAADPHQFREQMERVAPFAERVQIDLSDGVFAPSHTVSLEHAWWLKTVMADLHLMYKTPADFIETAIRLQPHLVIVHAEADGDFLDLAERLHAANIKAGVALLADTPVSKIELSLPAVDHVMIFAGDLGSFGGQADLNLLEKVSQLRDLKPELEIGWDGGINDKNAARIAAGGVDVLNVGGYIQKAENSEAAYGKLKSVVETVTSHETKNVTRTTGNQSQ